MSSNKLKFDQGNKLIQDQRNCVDMQGARRLNLNYLSKCHDDKCFRDIQTRQSMSPGVYQVTNHYDCDCNIPKTVKSATDNVMTFFRNGYDVAGCVVDDSTNLRIGAHKRFPKCQQQLFHRPYLTEPFRGRSSGNMVLESQLVPGEDTSVKKSCNTLSGITIPHYFTPLVPHLDYNVQNPEHIVQEVVDQGWVRGGANSRLIVRDVNYLEQCGYSYMDKETNREFWVDKHKYL